MAFFFNREFKENKENSSSKLEEVAEGRRSVFLYISVISYFRNGEVRRSEKLLCENVEINRLLKTSQRITLASKSLFARQFSQR